ncbi:MAG: PspC domain-containing protein [Muribaculaceae bacterium]|nr:PspC domain-containing protein [Muribaculaceae bacterium]
MKKIVNVNIGGIPFTLDEDAYQLLGQYLTTLRGIYHEDDEDMLTDIEARIAELLLQNVPEGRIVTMTDVKREIGVIGDPKDFDDEEIVKEDNVTVNTEGAFIETETSRDTTIPPVPPVPQIEHKLYRDPRNKMIAGVCSGIAAYNHMSVNTVRLLAVAGVFLTAFFPLGAILSIWLLPIIYACFWIAVPEAQTPLQFMQLYGEGGSMADVAKAVSYQYDVPASGSPYPESPTGFWSTVGRIIMAIVKGFFAFLAIVGGVPLMIGLIIVIVVLVIAGIAELCAMIGHTNLLAMWPFMGDIMSHIPGQYGWTLLTMISALGALLIPAWFLIRSVFRLEPRFPLSRRSRIIWLVVWILCILLATTGVAVIAA